QPNCTYIFMPLSPDSGIPAKTDGPAQGSTTPPNNPDPTKEIPAVPNPMNNGRQTNNGDPVPTPPPGVTDPLEEAEAIRRLLAEGQSRLTRLIGALKLHKKQTRAVAQAVASLRQLPPLTP